MVSRYVNGPVKQEGLCLMPPHPQSYRMMPPQRPADGFHVTPQSFVPQQQQSQGNNQGPTLRGMGPTGPPTQASTPPNTDLKVQQLPQASINLAYVNQSQVRGAAPPYYPRPPPQPSQTQPRMSGGHRQAQPIYPQQTPQFVPMATGPVQMYVNAVPYSTYSTAPRPQAGYQHTFQMIPNQQIAYPPFVQTQTQPQTTYFYNNQIALQRSGPPPPQVQSQPLNNTQPQQATIPINPTVTQQQSMPPKSNRRRAKAIPIIDPTTGKDKLNEMYEQDESHPASGESSARQTPQPPPPNPSKEVQAAFAKQVAQAISNDQQMDELEQLDHIGHHMYHQPTPPAVFSSSNMQHLVQTSRLQLPAKDFVPASAQNTAQNTAKETPVVSALTDAVEVTITNKLTKDRESPSKGRKKEQQLPREHKEFVKENVIKDNVNAVIEKPLVVREEMKQKDTVITNVAPVVPVACVIAPVCEITEQPFVQAIDKKITKKEKDVKVQQPVSVFNQDIVVDINIQAAPGVPAGQDNAANNGKSKQNASQKPKEAPKQPPVPIKQAPAPVPAPVPVQAPAPTPVPALTTPTLPVVVPTSQPPKPHNKTSKQRDINLKGASKEGTDMDAFSDSGSPDAVNANIPENNDNIFVNEMLNNNNSNVLPEKIEKPSNDVTTIKPEIKSLPKGKIDITDIVKDVPKPMKTTPEELDETDRISNEKLVLAKNEANTKASIENNDSTAEIKPPELPYKSDQWSPLNQDGKKIYDKDFLMALRYYPTCKKRPDNIPTELTPDDKARLGDINRFPIGGRTTDFSPNFTNPYPNKNSSQRGGVPPKRGSQQGKVGGAGKSNKPNLIRVSISVKEDVKLHETANAWKPTRLNSTGVLTEDDKKTEELYKKVRGILNKLTPQKFQTLVSQINNLTIDTTGRLQGVIDLVFEKAVDEPNFSVAYALLCRELALMQVPANAEGKQKDAAESVNFRKLLVNRCQQEFEKNSFDESTRNQKVKEVEECADSEKKKELQLELEDYDRRIRQKSVGNIRFIGELFKQHMLTANIMERCLTNLLQNKDEESLECLCKLLTTVGKELEVAKRDLNGFFTTMKEIVDKKHGRISSRVRFMLQDVIDLRNSKWVSRRQDLNPKTMDQIQKEAENEQLNIQAMNSVPMTPRKDDRTNAVPNSDRKRRNIPDDGWLTAPSRSRTPFSVQSDKLKSKMPLLDEPLGSSKMFGNWSRGSNTKTAPTAPPNTVNMYAALENIDADRRPPGVRPNEKEAYSSKGPSLERYKFDEGRGSRSGSLQRSRDSSVTSQRNTPTPTPKPQPAPVASVVELTPEQLERRIKNIVEEYLNDCCSIAECDQDIRSSIAPAYMWQLVVQGHNDVLERSKTARNKTGYLFAQLIKRETLIIGDYCKGLEETLSTADDLTIDIPKIWEYLAELIAPLLCEEALSFTWLLKSFNLLISQSHAPKLLTPIFKIMVQDKGPNFLQHQWANSGVVVGNFMREEEVESYIRDNNFEFLLEGGGESPVGQSQLTYPEISDKLFEFFLSEASFDDIINWITANVGDRIKEHMFIRTLATAIFQSSIVNGKLKADILKKHYRLMHRFVDGNMTYELHCLYALQALINKLEHPQGILLLICDRLYEDNVFSLDSFMAWETSNDPGEQEGKGVALKQLTSFFTQLKEAEEESSSTASDVEA